MALKLLLSTDFVIYLFLWFSESTPERCPGEPLSDFQALVLGERIHVATVLTPSQLLRAPISSELCAQQEKLIVIHVVRGSSQIYIKDSNLSLQY